MLKTFRTSVVSLLVILFVNVFARAQSEDPKVEVGIQFSALRNGIGFWYDHQSGLGGGGRLTVNLNKHLALEAEMNYFPGSGYYNLRRLQGQFGVKSGIRSNQIGVFGKIRPGFIQSSYEVQVFCIQAPCPPLEDIHTGFSLDVGGVVEFYPTRRLTVRFDLGDTVLHRSRFPFGIPIAARDSLALWVPPKQTTHNLQINAGIGFRF